ncbi:MAG TPA: sulfite oxidase [Pseudonocardia sp.]
MDGVAGGKPVLVQPKALWGKRNDMIIHDDDPFNAEPARAALASAPLTSAEVFYSRNHGPIPEIDPGSWRLRVDGLVGAALEVSLEDLRRQFPHRELIATLQCAGNRRSGLLAVRDIPGEAPWGPGATSTARWSGVSLADVLAAAQPSACATHVAFTAPDIAADAEPQQPYGGSVTLAKAMAGEVLLAWEMNGEPLPRIHGAPVRVIVPGYVGARSVKWVTRVTVQDAPSDNYFQAVAYRLLPADADPSAPHPDGFALGAAALNADVLVPDDDATVPVGPTRVCGYAFAGDDRGIARVDVSTNGGASWRQAELDTNLGPWAWRFWHTELDLPRGDTEVVVRAWDTSAAAMPEDPAHLWNPKGYVNNAWARITVHAR